MLENRSVPRPSVAMTGMILPLTTSIEKVRPQREQLYWVSFFILYCSVNESTRVLSLGGFGAKEAHEYMPYSS